MIVPVLSLLAIVAAIAVGTLRRVNIGLISIVFAFAIGRFLVELPAGEIVSGWPLSLFFMLLGVTLLFGIARVNGTLELLANRAVDATFGRTRLIPPAFFLLAALLAAIGAGNIVVCAIVLPLAMTVAVDHRISPLLMATMVIAGSNAGGLSPIAPTGIIADSLSADQGFDIAGSIFYKQVVGQTILACILYFALKGHRLDEPTGPGPGSGASSAAEPRAAPATDSASGPGPASSGALARSAFDRIQVTTLAVVFLVVLAIVFAGWDVGLAAFAGAVVLLFLGAAEEGPALASIPWGTIILVCGVSVLVNVAESAGGIDLLSNQLTRLMTDRTAAPVMALVGGTLSLVSSASGVVLPTLIPTVPGLVGETGADPTQLISAIVMGAHMVTNSPISTLGALAVASAVEEIDRTRLFNSLFVVGVAGLLYAAVIVYLGIV